MLTQLALLAYFSFFTASLSFSQESGKTSELPALTVMGQETANQRPVNTYETPISNLDFDPRVDMQSRNMAEAQGDLSIRGGTFEESGIQVGSATLLDPQTGHYTTEIPIAPEMMGEPKVLIGVENALRGFNSTTGTISYEWSEIRSRGSLTAGGGDHNLNFQRLYHALSNPLQKDGWKWGAEIESSRSESDGTIAYGDHDFDRATGRFQLAGPNTQTDFFAGYQEKFFGWPGMYTANNALLETEDLQTRLFLINHRHNYDEESQWEFSTAYRRNTDHFDLRRDDPTSYFADHITKMRVFAITGHHSINDYFSLNYSTQYVEDEIESLRLGQGDFNQRDYFKIGILPEYHHPIDKTRDLILKAGATLDDSNRDGSEISPLAEIRLDSKDEQGNAESSYLSYSEATQVLGYSAIGGATGSPWISDPKLRRGISRNLEVGTILKRSNWKLSAAIFKRWDKDLVDWVYQGNGSNRSAKHLDLETLGLEIIASREWNNLEVISSYAYLRKDEEYGDPSITGSVYALNYPENRLTLGMIINPSDSIEVRIDNEWRDQRPNLLRSGSDRATYSHLASSYYPSFVDDLEIFIAYEKPWDEDFQDIPGTPGRGDQFSLGATYSW